MYQWNLENERLEAEAYLNGRRADFTTTYMRVANLQFIIEQQPEILHSSTVAALLCVLEGTEHNRQRQVFFLFKKAADALAAIICHAKTDGPSDQARHALAHILCTQNGPPFRAAAEAMGALPLSRKGPMLNFSAMPEPPVYQVRHLAELLGEARPAVKWIGRNLVTTLPSHPDKRFVLKFAKPGQSLTDLVAETRWMAFLGALKLPGEYRFDMPEPMALPQPVVYKIHTSALSVPDSLDIDPNYHATLFFAPKGYFRYPNHSTDNRMPDRETCRAIICKNARRLAHLASLGIIHTAPIPLFHNRVQRHRREDRGLYQWRRAGRLDQWLASCRYPNIGASGIRDFEHFIAFDGPARRLYDHIGAHVFSLILIAGSYFRNHDESRVGLDANGDPIDARALFDRKWLARILAEVFDNYYQGFTGFPYARPYPGDLENLSRRLVEEMGVDRHMEEILRAAEQNAMSITEFHEFLAERGYTREQIDKLNKGAQDIAILTGPHLGGFNQRISVPELTEYTAALAAICIMDRYWGERMAS